MRHTSQAWTDERADRIIGILLRTGLAVSVVVVAAGGVMFLLRYGGAHPDYGTFRGEPPELRRLRGIVHEAIRLSIPALIQLGLVLLVATPVARVAFSVFVFAAERDRTYVMVTLIVLTILVLSIAGVI
jgi:uncharacterized membrane protein